MLDNLIAVYGASGFGRQVMPVLRAQIAALSAKETTRLVFVDDNCLHDEVNGQSVLTYEGFLRVKARNKFAAIAIANSKIREKLALRCEADGISPFPVEASNRVCMDDVQIAPGAIFLPFTLVTSNVVIGKYFHANSYSSVAHDCVIGDYVTFAPRATCNGNVHIHNHAYIGNGAVLKQGTPDQPLIIGEGAVVGMGAVVTKSVPAGAVVVGNPAKPLVKS